MYFAPAHKLVDLPATTKAASDTLKEIAVEPTGESWFCCYVSSTEQDLLTKYYSYRRWNCLEMKETEDVNWMRGACNSRFYEEDESIGQAKSE